VLLFPDVPHHDIDEGVLDEAEEHKEGAGGHEHVYRLEKKIKGQWNKGHRIDH
jgi:hypothetical protein